MSMDRDIERFIELVKRESAKDEDFVEERVRKTVLFKLLESRYDNVDELMEMALKKSSWFERMRDALDYEWRRAINSRAYDEDNKRSSERLLAYMSFGSPYKEVYEKFMWRYGRDEMLKLALEVVSKYDKSGAMIGKFKNVGGFWNG